MTDQQIFDLVSQARVAWRSAGCATHTAETRREYLAKLKSYISQLEAAGFKVSGFEEIIHVYRADLVETEIWRDNLCVGLTARTAEEWQTSIYKQLWKAAALATKLKQSRLMKHYSGGIALLKTLWDVKHSTEPTIKTTRILCPKQ